MEVKEGMFQAKCGTHILGYHTTKADAIKQAVEYSKSNAMGGASSNADWYVGLVVGVDSNTVFAKHQMSDGSGRFEGGYNKYNVVVVSIVAFGFATYKYSRTVANTGSQGRTR